MFDLWLVIVKHHLNYYSTLLVVTFLCISLQISDVAEEEVKKLEKKYREGTSVRVRILGFRHLEGLATGILKVGISFL